MTELKALEWEKALNEGIEGKSGKVYRFESELSVRRYHEAMKYKVHMSYGLEGVEALHEKLTAAYELMNSGKLADGIADIKKILVGTQQLSNNFYPGMMLCAIYFNTEDEDRMGFSETDMVQKAKDWEHYGITGFFTLACRLLGIQSENLRAITLTSLAKEEKPVSEVLPKSSKK